MSMALLDGTSAVFSLVIGTQEYKCMANYISADIGNELFEQTTFCTSGWRSRIRGLKQMVGRLAGFMFKGVAHADPLVLFAGSTYIAFIMTFDTGCILSGNLQPRNQHMGMAAAGNSELGLDFESYGIVGSSWVVA